MIVFSIVVSIISVIREQFQRLKFQSILFQLAKIFMLKNQGVTMKHGYIPSLIQLYQFVDLNRKKDKVF